MQILVLGMHRSGTSATARLINLMGAYFGPQNQVVGTNTENPKGFWERRDVIKANNALLALQQCQWHTLAQWDESKATIVPDALQQELRDIIAELEAHTPWFIKDPRLCLTLPAWRPLLQKPVAVLVYRDPAEIALSLHTRNTMSPDYALALWEYYSVGALNASFGMPRLFVQYRRLLQDPLATCSALYKQLAAIEPAGLVMPAAAAITSFIDPALYRSKITAMPAALSAEQLKLSAILQGRAPQTALLTVSENARATIQKK